ncbi:MAG: c-type cytochrome biogenesis protein CcmI [Gemmobacter sp.]
MLVDGMETMSLFWAAAAAMTLMTAVLLVLAVRRGGDAQVPSSARDADVYRDQLAEIERDRARGVIAPDEAERMRAEVARRLIAADGRIGGTALTARGPFWPAAGIAAVLVVGGGVWGYLHLGAPGYPDLPLSARFAMAEEMRAARPSQEASEAGAPALAMPAAPADFVGLMAQLREKVAQRPDDLTGHRLLADYEARLGNMVAARLAQARVIEIQKGAAPAPDFVLLARYMMAAAGGTISPEAEAALIEALRRDEDEPDALFFYGIARMQTGRPDLGFRAWAQYLRVAPPDSPWQDEVRARIADLAAIAGERFTPPAPRAGAEAPGPDAAAMAAAEAMSPEERAQMVRGMVDQLGERLAREGGTAEDWARMIRALGVLGETARARAIRDEARATFAGRSADLALVEAAARDAGAGE